MSEWKDGDEAMVTLYRVHGHLAEVECGEYLRTVHVECLHPLLTAAQTPPKLDPVEVFYEAAKGHTTVCGNFVWGRCRSTQDTCICRDDIARGLAAVDAARGAK